MIGRLLCRLGWHSWIRTTSEAPVPYALVCVRCSARREGKPWPPPPSSAPKTEGETTTETDDPPPKA
jgi:hypothetical protein